MANITGQPNGTLSATLTAYTASDYATPELWNEVYQKMLTNDAVLDRRVGLLEASGTGGGATDASALTYTPANVANWTGNADPGNTNQALDQLATRLTAARSVRLPHTFAVSGPITNSDNFLRFFVPAPSGQAVRVAQIVAILASGAIRVSLYRNDSVLPEYSNINIGSSVPTVIDGADVTLNNNDTLRLVLDDATNAVGLTYTLYLDYTGA